MELGHNETANGDPACWVARLCPECDAVPDAGDAPRCWRCGRHDAPTTTLDSEASTDGR